MKFNFAVTSDTLWVPSPGQEKALRKAMRSRHSELCQETRAGVARRVPRTKFGSFRLHWSARFKSVKTNLIQNCAKQQHKPKREVFQNPYQASNGILPSTLETARFEAVLSLGSPQVLGVAVAWARLSHLLERLAPGSGGNADARSCSEGTQTKSTGCAYCRGLIHDLCYGLILLPQLWHSHTSKIP